MIDPPAAGRLRSAIGLRRSQAEEAVTVPARAGHRFGDLGEAAIGLAIPGEALFQDRHPFQPAFPFTDQHCSRSQIDPLPRRGDASFKQTAFRGVGSLASRLTNDAQRCVVETAERGGLDLIGQDPEQQPTRQMGGRGPAQVVAPLQAKPTCVEISEARDQIAEGRCLVRSLRRRRAQPASIHPEDSQGRTGAPHRISVERLGSKCAPERGSDCERPPIAHSCRPLVIASCRSSAPDVAVPSL